MTTVDWLERARRTRRWRLWVNGLRLFVPSIPVGTVIGILHSHGVLPGIVAVPLLVVVLLAGLVGWGMAVVGLLTVFRGDSVMVNAHRTRVFGALVKDLFSLHAPPPLVEKPWPPPMRPSAGEARENDRS